MARNLFTMRRAQLGREYLQQTSGGIMARISGLEKKQAPWHLRWSYAVMRKMFGKELTPAKLQMRLPGIVWGAIAMEAGLGRKRRVSLRYTQLGKVRTAARVGCPF